jgi:hypothetical protein
MILSLIIIVFIIAFIAIQKFLDHINQNQNRSDCYYELNRNVSGVVSKAYYDDDINVKAFVISFTNGKKYVSPIFLKSLNGYIIEGDSIYKVPNTFKFYIFKQRNTVPIIFEDTTVNCDKLSY